MAKNIFMGINGVARKVPKVYIGDNDVARKIKKAYIGDANGKAHLFFSGGVDVASIAITYTGNYTDKVVTMSGKTYRLLTLTSSGTLNLETEVAADVWMCSGGTSGNDGNVSSSHKNMLAAAALAALPSSSLPSLPRVIMWPLSELVARKFQPVPATHLIRDFIPLLTISRQRAHLFSEIPLTCIMAQAAVPAAAVAEAAAVAVMNGAALAAQATRA